MFKVVTVAAPVLALMAILPLLEVARVMVPEVDWETTPSAVSAVPPVMEMVPVVAVTMPVLAVPRAVTVRGLAPRVIVCPVPV